MSTPMCRAPGSTRGHTCRSTRLTISSVSPRSCRASSGACATAPPPTRTRRRAPRWCARSPPPPGSSRGRRGPEHDPEKWEPVFGKDHAQKKKHVKTFALALGAGGARGLAHIAVIEALDEMEIAPVAIAGSSIGAVIGAGYAAGLSGRAMRRHLIKVAHDRGEVLRRVMAARAVAWSEILGAGFGNPLVVDGEKFYDAFLAGLLPASFADLTIPLMVVTADLHRREAVILTEGPLRPAISSALAVPGLVRPV